MKIPTNSQNSRNRISIKPITYLIAAAILQIPCDVDDMKSTVGKWFLNSIHISVMVVFIIFLYQMRESGGLNFFYGFLFLPLYVIFISFLIVHYYQEGKVRQQRRAEREARGRGEASADDTPKAGQPAA